jgi:peptidoglycan/LPS O-acetylase OafA/YrhL
MKETITATAASADPQDTGQSKNPNHLAPLDALRGLAALLVVLYHLLLVPQPNLPVSPLLRPFILSGRTGVVLFFVVSAFTLCLSSSTRKEKSHPVRAFYIRRVFRIVPLYYVLLLVTVWRDSHFSGLHYSVSDIARCLTFTFNFVPGKSEGIVQASWTLGVEMLFYLLFPLFFARMNTLSKAVVFFFAALCLSLGFEALVSRSALPPALQSRFFYFSFLHSLPVFAMGFIVFYAYSDKRFRHALTPMRAGWLLTASLLTYLFLSYSAAVPARFDFCLHALVFASVIVGLIALPIPALVNLVSCWLGTISYSLYLLHPVCLWLLGSLYPKIYRHLPETPAFAVCFACTLCLLIPFAYATYSLIEVPGIRAGSRLIKALARRMSADKVDASVRGVQVP